MKTIYVTLSLLATTLAFAAPAAAECTDTPTGGFACVAVQDRNNADVYVDQPGVANAGYNMYEFTFWGQTMRGKSAWVSTAYDGPAGPNSVSVNEFCFADPSGGCTFQDDSVTVSTGATGYSNVGLAQSPDGRTVCVASGDVFQCQGF